MGKMVGEQRGTKTHQRRNRRRGEGEVKAAVITESPDVKEWERYLWGFHFPVWAGFLGFGVFFTPTLLSAHKFLPEVGGVCAAGGGCPICCGGSERIEAVGC